MLVSSLQDGEGFVIGHNIYVKVIRRKGQGLMIGVSAPRDIQIKRVGQDGQLLTRLGTNAASVPDCGANGSSVLLGEPAASVTPPLSLQCLVAQRKSVDHADGLNG